MFNFHEISTCLSNSNLSFVAYYSQTSHLFFHTMLISTILMQVAANLTDLVDVRLVFRADGSHWYNHILLTRQANEVNKAIMDCIQAKMITVWYNHRLLTRQSYPGYQNCFINFDAFRLLISRFCLFVKSHKVDVPKWVILYFLFIMQSY